MAEHYHRRMHIDMEKLARLGAQERIREIEQEIDTLRKAFRLVHRHRNPGDDRNESGILRETARDFAGRQGADRGGSKKTLGRRAEGPEEIERASKNWLPVCYGLHRGGRGLS